VRFIDQKIEQPHIYNHNATERGGEERVRKVFEQYEAQTEEEAAAEETWYGRKGVTFYDRWITKTIR
jgi:hypothetical protein